MLRSLLYLLHSVADEVGGEEVGEEKAAYAEAEHVPEHPGVAAQASDNQVQVESTVILFTNNL